jgi:hypothetical protein
MPIAFVGTQVSAEDRRTAEEIMANASEHVTKVTREVGQLRSFMHANNFGPDIEDGEILVLFAAQWKNAGRSLATANQIIQDFRTHGVRPREADLAEQKLRHERALNALKRSAARAERRYRVIPLERVVSPFRRPDKGTHADRWAFWFLLIVTGNRAYNVLELRALRATADYLDVDWGPRKVHSNTTARYYYWWSGTPPPLSPLLVCLCVMRFYSLSLSDVDVLSDDVSDVDALPDDDSLSEDDSELDETSSSDDSVGPKIFSSPSGSLCR